ncbi:helix-turn-helix domain-containing protein [Sinimarinibacterium flocculans]|uniref:helix-turn-helix domain-containing protein n=1 Tax=Sinimarinibacterium flocculans TaxID=985250 RepID=UPI0035130BB1
MADISSAFKAEITRLSNKAVRQHVSPIRSATSKHRHEIATLKRQLEGLEHQLARLLKAPRSPAVPVAETENTKTRFVAKGLRSLRARLGLTADDFGKLVGVSGQSVYLWEREKARPRSAQVAAIAAVRSIGKREAQARLEGMR